MKYTCLAYYYSNSLKLFSLAFQFLALFARVQRRLEKCPNNYVPLFLEIESKLTTMEWKYLRNSTQIVLSLSSITFCRLIDFDYLDLAWFLSLVPIIMSPKIRKFTSQCNRKANNWDFQWQMSYIGTSKQFATKELTWSPWVWKFSRVS